jgi:predicted phosphoadenosine phosphosulfate sulfurtransferase
MDEVIAQFEKNATEVVRVSLSEYRGHKLFDVRVYYSDDEGQYKPTRKGVSLSVNLYTDFKRAILALEKILLDNNLITQADLEEAAVAEADKE